jgi:predicted nucleic acid-binding protein
MIVLDTNVVSETMRVSPSTVVLDWLNSRATSSLFLTSVTIAEIEYGLKSLPEGRRRRSLTERFGRFITQAFEERIMNFDQHAARVYGDIMAHRKRIGRPMSVQDGQIAAMARLKGFSLATRNTRDFLDCEIELINPFKPGREESA